MEVSAESADLLLRIYDNKVATKNLEWKLSEQVAVSRAMNASFTINFLVHCAEITKDLWISFQDDDSR